MKKALKFILTTILIMAITGTSFSEAATVSIMPESKDATQEVTFEDNGELFMYVDDVKKLRYSKKNTNGIEQNVTKLYDWVSSNDRVATATLVNDEKDHYVNIKAFGAGTAKIIGKIKSRTVISIIVTVRNVPLHMTVKAHETNVSGASKGCTLIGVEGTYERVAKKKILKRINEIRYEACEKGFPNPLNPKKKLTLDDYVPIKWSSDLERIAQIRAAESTVREAHKRPNGKDCSTVTHNGIIAIRENLAWNNYGIMRGIEQWYEEKNDWVEQNNNRNNHYLSIMAPDITYIGIGGFVKKSGGWHGIAGVFTTDADAKHSVTDSIYELLGKNSYIGWDDNDWEGGMDDKPDGLDSLDDLYRLYGIKSLEELKELKTLKLPEEQSNLKGKIIQAIEVLSSKLGKAKLDAPKSIKKGKKQQIFVTRPIYKASGIVLDVQWESSNESVISIAEDGTITAIKPGKAVITAKFDNKTLKKTISVKK